MDDHAPLLGDPGSFLAVPPPAAARNTSVTAENMRGAGVRATGLIAPPGTSANVGGGVTMNPAGGNATTAVVVGGIRKIGV
jgi:hypothetical protein